MIILRNKECSEKSNLKFLDRIEVKGLEGRNQDYRDEIREMYTSGKPSKKSRTQIAASVAAVGAGNSIAKSIMTPNTSLPSAALGAAVSAGLGYAEGDLASRIADKIRQHKLKDNPKAYEKAIDRINVVEGKMSEEEFIKKYYHKKFAGKLAKKKEKED